MLLPEVTDAEFVEKWAPIDECGCEMCQRWRDLTRLPSNLRDRRLIGAVKKTTTDVTKEYLQFMDQGFILPRGCRYWKPVSEVTSLFLVEETPRMRTIRVQFRRDVEVELLTVPFPYVVSKVNVCRTKNGRYVAPSHQVFWTKEPLKSSLLTPTFYPMTSNSWADGNYCGFAQLDGASPADVVDAVITDYWGSTFRPWDMQGTAMYYASVGTGLACAPFGRSWVATPLDKIMDLLIPDTRVIHDRITADPSFSEQVASRVGSQTHISLVKEMCDDR